LMIKNGDVAPDFALPAMDGSTFRLGERRGRPVVLYFYPKDHTPGCTAEARAFRDRYETFAAAGADVVGVSSDSIESHQRFGGWTLLNVYVGAHLAAGAVGVGRVLAWAGALALAGLPIATLVLGRRGPLRPALGWIGFTVLGLSTLLVVGFAVVDLVRLPVG